MTYYSTRGTVVKDEKLGGAANTVKCQQQGKCSLVLTQVHLPAHSLSLSYTHMRKTKPQIQSKSQPTET